MFGSQLVALFGLVWELWLSWRKSVTWGGILPAIPRGFRPCAHNKKIYLLSLLPAPAVIFPPDCHQCVSCWPFPALHTTPLPHSAPSTAHPPPSFFAPHSSLSLTHKIDTRKKERQNSQDVRDGSTDTHCSRRRLGFRSRCPLVSPQPPVTAVSADL